MTPEQAAIIKSTVPVLAQYGETITTKFYANLLREKSALHSKFGSIFPHMHSFIGLAALISPFLY